MRKKRASNYLANILNYKIPSLIALPDSILVAERLIP